MDTLYKRKMRRRRKGGAVKLGHDQEKAQKNERDHRETEMHVLAKMSWQ